MAATSTNPVIAEHHRIEQLVASLRIGETAVYNGFAVTAISLADDLALSRPEVREAVATYRTAAARASALVIEADLDRMTDLDADSLAAAEDLMAGSLAVLVEAGVAHLVVPGRPKAGA
jgi:hypothetical protein